MTQKAVKNIPEKKIKAVQDIKDLINNSKTVLIASIKNIPGSQFQEIGKKLRGTAIVKVPKKNLVKRAFNESKKVKIKELVDQLKDSFALLFSDLDSYELAGVLLKNRTAAKAKTGQIAPEDIEVPAGPTDLVPGPAISELGALGIQIKIQGGKIEIREPKVIAKKGTAISQGAAEIMSKLDIKPFSIGFKPVCAYDSVEDKIYLDIKIDREGILASLLDSYARALPFALEISYVTEDTVKLMIQKAGSYEKKLVQVISGKVVKEIVAPEGVPSEEGKEKKEETKKDAPDEKKEETVDASAGLSSMFG